MIRSCTFEVCVEVSGKSEIEGIYAEELAALDRAEYLLKQAKYTAVRVYRVNARDSHKIIFEKFYTGSGAGSSIGNLDEAYLCTSVSDVYSFESRQTLLRLMRRYFDQQVTVPLELLHNYQDLRYLERDALLFKQAGHRLAALQAQAARLRAHERHTVLEHLFKDVLEQARSAELLIPYYEALTTRGLHGLTASVAGQLPVGEHGRAISFAIGHYLHEARNWALKVTMACDLFDDGLDETSAMWLDECLAEVIDGNAAVKAVVGYAPDLATALEALLAVIEGSWDDRLPGTPPLLKLNDIMGQRSMPRVRTALLNRITGAMASRIPLTKLDRPGNAEALRRLLPKLMEFGGFMGGAAMSAALTRRAKVDFGSRQEDLSFEMAVQTLLGFLNSPAGRIGYLLDLLSSDMGRMRASFLTQQIADLFSGLRSVSDFAPDLDSSWSQDMIQQDFRRRLYRVGIPRRLAEGLLQKLQVLQNSRIGGLALPPAPAARALAPPAGSGVAGELELIYRGTRHGIKASDTPFTIGRGDACRLMVDWAGASRAHAVIQVEGSNFVLLDQSKNGTFVHIESHDTVCLAKTATVLTGQGTITVGIIGDDPEGGQRAVIEFKLIGSG